MKRLLALLVTLIAAWLGVISPVAAVAAPPQSVPVFTYGTKAYDQPTDDAALERSRPNPPYNYTTYDAVDPWSPSASARSSDSATPVIYAYDDAARLVRSMRGSHGVERATSIGEAGFAVVQRSIVAAESVDELAGIGFRSDTSHVFRNAAGHLADDTAENRALIKSALDPADLRDTITLKDGATLQKYFRDLPDGTQAWAEVRNGETTNGGLNVIPR